MFWANRPGVKSDEKPSIYCRKVRNLGQGRFVPAAGGVLIIEGESMVVGAVGVSGDTSEIDEYCAILIPLRFEPILLPRS